MLSEFQVWEWKNMTDDERNVRREEIRKEQQSARLLRIEGDRRGIRGEAVFYLNITIIMTISIYLIMWTKTFPLWTMQLFSVVVLCMVVSSYRDYIKKTKEIDDVYTIEALKY